MKHQILLAACIATSITSAQVNETNTANQVIVSATRIDTPIEQIGSSISVISSKEIERQHSRDVQSALRQTPGIQMTQNGGPGTASSVFIRGANANHTLVLVNGIRINSNTTGGFNLSTIPTDSIDRVEILRGPQSALYGGDSIGGVVNIVTKKGVQGFGGNVLIEAGTKDSGNTVANIYGGGKTIDFNASVSYLTLRNYDIEDDDEKDPYERLSFFTDLGLNFATDGRADFVVMYNKNDTSLDGYYDGTKTDFLFGSLNISKPITDLYEQSLTFGYNKTEIADFRNGIEASSLQTINYDVNAQANLFLHEKDTLMLGYDFRRTEGENDGSIPMTHRNQNSLYANNQFNLNDRFFFELGARYDDYSDYDSKVTWQTKVSWELVDNSRFHGSIGTGYKVPTFNGLYYFSSAVWGTYMGNPDLRPEESFSYEIGFEQAFNDREIIFDITLFHNQIDDLIQWSRFQPTNQPYNVNSADIKGIETSLTYQPVDELNTKAYYTYTMAKDANTDKWLARRAQNNAGFIISWDYLKNANVNLDLVYVGKRYDDPDNTGELDPYGLIHFGTSYNITKSFKILFNINNLLNKHYETAAGYGNVGRVVSAGVSYTF